MRESIFMVCNETAVYCFKNTDDNIKDFILKEQSAIITKKCLILYCKGLCYCK